jgi:UPF0271 protein
MVTVDLNCDLGESFGAWRMGDDDALLPLISTANVACGFHAGDPQTMLATCRAAAALGVTVAAHPGYRDLVGFGRRDIAMAPDALRADLLYQVSALTGVAAAASTVVRALKPHGALYNRAAVDPVTAGVVAEVAAECGLPLVGLAGSAAEAACASGGVRFIAEAFVDRGYRPDGTLAPRGEPGAVLTDPPTVAARAVRMVREGRVDAVDGTPLTVRVESLCVHSDTPGAVTIARAVRDALREAGITVQAAA